MGAALAVWALALEVSERALPLQRPAFMHERPFLRQLQEI
jgi:hypothetical protein